MAKMKGKKATEKKTTRPSIPVHTKTRLWMASGGRCQFDGCNTHLWKHHLTMDEMNRAYIAHIYAYSVGGARYDTVLSPKLEVDFSNLMLVCDSCHRLFDDLERAKTDYPATRLIKMKQDHESRIERLTAIKQERQSHMLLYGSKIGEHDTPLTYNNGSLAMKESGNYPAKSEPIALGMSNSTFKDNSDLYWSIQEKQLESAFERDVRPLVDNHEVQRFSVFALAPQPLLIKIGVLLGDINSVDVYQKHRVPDTWEWQENASISDYTLEEPSYKDGIPALVFSLSGTVTDDRILEVLGNDASIWKITIDNPNNDFLKTKELLQKFGRIAHSTLDKMKVIHGQETELHVFPAMPVSAAIQFGRIWMPKADMPMVLYDQNPITNGFSKSILIKHS